MDDQLIRSLILSEGLLEEKKLREVEALAASSDASLLDLLLKGSHVEEQALLTPLATSFGVSWMDIDEVDDLDADLWSSLPGELRQCENFVPLRKNGDGVLIASCDILDTAGLDLYKVKTSWKLKIVLSSREKIDKTRKRLLEGASTPMAEDLEIIEEVSTQGSLEDLANEAPVIKLVNLILMQAISEDASDIHIEPDEDRAVLRHRIDGVLKEVATYTPEQLPAIVSRIKIMANLNIAERRIPQDGRISLQLMGKSFDLRVATIPVVFGEGVVMRILDKDKVKVQLAELGMSPHILEPFEKEIAKPNGIVLVTGPTGSGKTTTLYAALSSITSESNKIITIEDPVEYNIGGITQIQVNEKTGMSFAAGMRSILRLDPDIVMVGEMRDMETAETGIRAALTGHTVFSTLHTNDAPSAITRLIDMGIPAYLITSSMNAVLAQRLIRRVCPDCKEEVAIDELSTSLVSEVSKEIPATIARGKGCDECGGSGYRGRVGIHELLLMNDYIRGLTNERAPSERIRQGARESGMKTLREDGIDKMLAGLTTASEIIRITQE